MYTLKSKKSYTVGCDPEVFFLKKGKPFPAIGLVGGTKHSPRKLDVGAVQEDNVMAEFNTPPAETEQDFNNSVARMLENVRILAKNNGCELYISPYAEFEHHYLMHPQAQHIGCDPDYNAWSMQQNESPTPAALKNIRTASGHIHVGFPNPEDDPTTRYNIVKAMDLYLGVPSIVMEDDVIRRKFYGAAGSFRPKVYGVEYRVLSNFWILTPRLRKWVFKNTLIALHNSHNIPSWQRNERAFNNIRTCIDLHDVDMAYKLIKQFSVPMPKDAANGD